MRHVSRWLGAATLALALVSPAWAGQSSSPRAGAPASARLVDLNTASVAELESLPGVGARTAQLIVEHRQKNGGFKKIEELMNLRGIGEKSFLRLKPLVTVTTPAGEKGDSSGRR